VKKKTLIVAIIVLLLDQVSKIIVNNVLTKQVVVIPNFFNLTLYHNDGVAWNMLSSQRILIIIITIVAMIVLYKFMYSFKPNTRNNIAFGLLLGGLSGNLLDRLITGSVTDFLDFIIFKYDFPVFNVGDIGIVLGVLLLIYAIIKGEDTSENNSKSK
jgi:signal peptidase II